MSLPRGKTVGEKKERKKEKTGKETRRERLASVSALRRVAPAVVVPGDRPLTNPRLLTDPLENKPRPPWAPVPPVIRRRETTRAFLNGRTSAHSVAAF